MRGRIPVLPSAPSVSAAFAAGLALALPLTFLPRQAACTLTAALLVSFGFFFLRVVKPRHIDCSDVAFLSCKESLFLCLAFGASSAAAGADAEEVVSSEDLGLDGGRVPEMERRMKLSAGLEEALPAFFASPMAAVVAAVRSPRCVLLPRVSSWFL